MITIRASLKPTKGITMDFADVLKNSPLSVGGHSSPKEGNCVMEKVAMLWALHSGKDVLESFSDLPECTNSVIAKAAQAVNDRVSDEERQKLNFFIPRLLRARRTDSDPRIDVRLAIFSARYIVDLMNPRDREVCEKAILAAEAWLADPSPENAAATAAAYAAATSAAAYAASAASYAAYAASCAATCASGTPIGFLDALLDAWEEAVTKEGEDLYIPREWEDEALAFVSEYMVKTDG